MSSGSFKAQADVQCPFFKFDEDKKKRIVCEGFVDKSTLALIYCRKKDYETQLRVFCCEHYKKCEVYRMLMASKYEEDRV
jgi:hypothetical protein